jgi:hypothetical protein
MKRYLVLLPVLLIAMASDVSAKTAKVEPTYLIGGYTMAGFPTGDWGEIAGFGLGLDGTDVTFRKPGRPVALRSSFGFLYNFSRTQEVPPTNLGPNSALSLETKNGSVFFGLGPEIGQPNRNVNPFAFGTIGFNTYWTSSNLSGTAGGSPYSAKFGDSRIAFAWSAGLGVRKRMAEGHLVELSAEFRSGGGHMYVVPSEITNTGTTVNVDRSSRTTDQYIVRLGTVFGSLMSGDAGQ